MNIKLKPFQVPNFVIAESEPKQRQDGFSLGKSFSLGMVGSEELSLMCDEFRKEVFRKAGKIDPKRLEFD